MKKIPLKTLKDDSTNLILPFEIISQEEIKTQKKIPLIKTKKERFSLRIETSCSFKFKPLSKKKSKNIKKPKNENATDYYNFLTFRPVFWEFNALEKIKKILGKLFKKKNITIFFILLIIILFLNFNKIDIIL